MPRYGRHGCVRALPGKRLLASVFALAIACRPGETLPSSWNVDAAIYGTYDHYGNPPNGPATFICGVANDLHFRGTAPLDSVDISVTFPPAFAALPGSGVPSEPMRANVVSIDGHDVRAAAASSGHAAGAVGGICPNGPSDLPSLKGTVLHLRWREHGLDHGQDAAVDTIRELMREMGGDASTDWQPRFEWR